MRTYSIRRALYIAVLGASVFAFAQSVSAHAVSLVTVTTELTVRENRVELFTSLPLNLNPGFLPPEDERAFYNQEFQKRFLITQKNAQCSFVLEDIDSGGSAARSTYRGVFTCPENVSLEEITIEANIFVETFHTVEHFVTVYEKRERYEIVFSPGKTQYPAQVSARHAGSIFAYFFSVAGNFTWMGMHHIFGGYDHILFLLSIILLGRGVWRLVKVVTAFTLAHSITLLLASFNIVHIASSIVEPAIALSIVYVAYKNLTDLHDESGAARGNERALLAFGFGLIHGLGFAGALAETQIPQIFFVPALLSFNVGIEAGQLCILAVALPLLFLADRSRYRAQVFSVLTWGILLLAICWFFFRVFIGPACATIMPLSLFGLLCV